MNFFKKKNEKLFESAEDGLGVSPLGEEEIHAKEKEIKGHLRIREESNRWISLGVLTGYLSLALFFTPLLSFGLTWETPYNAGNFSSSFSGNTFPDDQLGFVWKCPTSDVEISSVYFVGQSNGTQGTSTFRVVSGNSTSSVGYFPQWPDQATTTFTFSPAIVCMANASIAFTLVQTDNLQVYFRGFTTNVTNDAFCIDYAGGKSSTSCNANIYDIQGGVTYSLYTAPSNNSTTTEYVLLDQGLTEQIDTMFGLFLSLGVIYVLWVAFSMVFRFIYQEND